jgi:hypothetical protein
MCSRISRSGIYTRDNKECWLFRQACVKNHTHSSRNYQSSITEWIAQSSNFDKFFRPRPKGFELPEVPQQATGYAAAAGGGYEYEGDDAATTEVSVKCMQTLTIHTHVILLGLGNEL